MRRSSTISCLAASLLLILCGIAFAQDNSKQQDVQQQKSSTMKQHNNDVVQKLGDNKFFAENLIPMDRLTGQDVDFQGEKDIEVSDLLVDPVTGNILFVVVSSDSVLGLGGDQYVLPFDSLKIHAQSRQLAINDKSITLDDNTAYAPKRNGRWGSEEVATYCATAGKKNLMKESRNKLEEMQQMVANAIDKVTDTGSKKTEAMGLECLVESNRLYNREVYGADNNVIGELSGFLVDLDEAKIKLAILDHGALWGLMGSQYLIPWQALGIDQQGKRIVLDVNEDNLDKFSKADELDWNGSILPKAKARDIYTNYEIDYTAG
ncbi:hypothetical protein DQK91_05605 [Oceanidesulfovibrio marinus]|uniref:PRC-barrel domain-containing protein n=2 Tax=Oceanidesulfovibrio marinus TaxID=370038 RepID=A0A6P1ZJG4_9BACT|nr:hypothetical protein DQK91_05605 [Oceanidesulfovibrio marinus]